jgi:hypothetical protein
LVRAAGIQDPREVQPKLALALTPVPIPVAVRQRKKKQNHQVPAVSQREATGVRQADPRALRRLPKQTKKRKHPVQLAVQMEIHWQLQQEPEQMRQGTKTTNEQVRLRAEEPLQPEPLRQHSDRACSCQ